MNASFDVRDSRDPADTEGSRPSDHPTQLCRICDINRETSICSRLPKDEFTRVLALRDQFQFPPLHTIFREGDRAAHIYALTSGSVKLYKLLSDGRRQIVGFLFPGDVFGLTNLGGYPYTAETLNQASTCRFPQKVLDPTRESVPMLERRMFDLAVRELMRAHEQMLWLGRKTAQERLASFLASLARRATERGQPESPVALPMSRSDIADFLGLTIETVSRTFTHLKKLGVILIPDNSHVMLNNVPLLIKLSEGGAE
ncbi:MAG: cyclic nucleotide-binding domain-containing protein [Alphaproteobacteria bacterium]|nr:cyclic nucleotide-binding domain-containing protein [Alphaproteobacteria bacterium]